MLMQFPLKTRILLNFHDMCKYLGRGCCVPELTRILLPERLFPLNAEKPLTPGCPFPFLSLCKTLPIAPDTSPIPLHIPLPKPESRHRLSLSMLKPSLLRTRFMTPSLKYLSSPVAVRPPIYHLSVPRTSLKPSLLLSLPLRRFGVGMGAALRGERTPGERDCCWGWEGMVLGAEGVDDEDAALLFEADGVGVEVLFGCCWWEGGGWRMEEKKVERKKGR